MLTTILFTLMLGDVTPGCCEGGECFPARECTGEFAVCTGELDRAGEPVCVPAIPADAGIKCCAIIDGAVVPSLCMDAQTATVFGVELMWCPDDTIQTWCEDWTQSSPYSIGGGKYPYACSSWPPGYP